MDTAWLAFVGCCCCCACWWWWCCRLGSDDGGGGGGTCGTCVALDAGDEPRDESTGRHPMLRKTLSKPLIFEQVLSDVELPEDTGEADAELRAGGCPCCTVASSSSSAPEAAAASSSATPAGKWGMSGKVGAASALASQVTMRLDKLAMCGLLLLLLQLLPSLPPLMTSAAVAAAGGGGGGGSGRIWKAQFGRSLTVLPEYSMKDVCCCCCYRWSGQAVARFINLACATHLPIGDFTRDLLQFGMCLDPAPAAECSYIVPINQPIDAHRDTFPRYSILKLVLALPASIKFRMGLYCDKHAARASETELWSLDRFGGSRWIHFQSQLQNISHWKRSTMFCLSNVRLPYSLAQKTSPNMANDRALRIRVYRCTCVALNCAHQQPQPEFCC